MHKKIAEVKFEESYKTYEFFNVFDDLKIGDKVVVDTVRGYGIAEVVAFKNQSRIANKYIVQKVDIDSHTKRIEEDKRKKELLEELKARSEELAMIMKYRELASTDEKMEDLLKEYDELN